MVEDYAVAAALHPPMFNGRDADAKPLPVPPGMIGTWELPDGLLLQIFNGGMERIAEVDPARVETFRRAALAAADESALPRENVRPTAAPVADAAAPRGADWSG